MKFLLTEYRGGVLTALTEDGRTLELDYHPKGDAGEVGDIYRVRVDSVSPSLDAAFLLLPEGRKGYLPLNEENKKLRPGRELTVQLTKAAVKTKLPVFSGSLSFVGKYLVLLSGKSGFHVSRKLERQAQEERLEMLLREEFPDSGFILRTNGGEGSEEEILAEARRLIRERESLETKAEHSPAPLLLRRESPYLARIRGLKMSETEEILTDSPALYEEIRTFLSTGQPEDAAKLRLYADPQISLLRLYSLEKAVSSALEKRVWLPSGGYLVIEPTEALTVVDVNSGKDPGKSSFEETVRRIDREAAMELLRQLRLRNISGIVVADFINMRSEEHRQELMRLLKQEAAKDPVRTEVLDMTALGLVELTRRKIGAPLAEKLARSGKDAAAL